MKKIGLLKKGFFIVLILLFLFVLSGYLFVEYKFSPDKNYLTVEGSSEKVPITWVENKQSSMAALLLPITINGISQKLYMQFDTGSPSTLFYMNKIQSIIDKYPEVISVHHESSTRVGLAFNLGEMVVKSSEFKIYDKKSVKIDWEDTSKIYVIGTIGSDLLEKSVSVIDFKNGECLFGELIPNEYKSIKLQDFTFYKRKTLFPAEIEGESCKLLHDTGTSGFELITSKQIWERMSERSAKPKEAFEVKSWNNVLKAYDIESDKQIHFDMSSIDLNKVTYVEGATFLQIVLMRMTGMGGLVGNELFRNKVLIMDCRNQKYAIVD
ncbi:MAG: hypothetical protein AAF363_21980 [Bacteroidota bacterium]